MGRGGFAALSVFSLLCGGVALADEGLELVLWTLPEEMLFFFFFGGGEEKCFFFIFFFKIIFFLTIKLNVCFSSGFLVV